MRTPYKYIPVLSPLYRSLRSIILPLLYRGKNVTCPLCNSSFSSWIGNQDFGSCPRCQSAARHRLLYLFLHKYSSLFKSSHKVLHFAPERSWENKLKSLENIYYVTAD